MTKRTVRPVSVTVSSGCVFCDMELDPEFSHGRLMHMTGASRLVPCGKWQAVLIDHEVESRDRGGR